MICLVAATGAVLAALSADAVTLAWTHSVEKTIWEEDWRVVPAGLEIVEARIRGSGAGMEPPPEAVLAKGAFAWRPKLPVLPEIVLRRSGATADWRLCVAGEGCRELSAFVPPETDPVIVKPCRDGVSVP